MKCEEFQFALDKINGYKYSGLNLIDEISQLNVNSAIDVGCGYNFFKGKIPGLIGFDTASYPTADFCADMRSVVFDKESTDLVLCLGSVQFSDSKQEMFNLLEKIVSWVRPKGYIVMRFHPFTDYVNHNESYINDPRICRISTEDFVTWTDRLGLSVYKQPVLDINSNMPRWERLVWWWKKH